MLNKIILTIAILFSNQVKSQELNDESETFSFKLYSKCFENLNQGKAIFERYPDFNSVQFCSLLYCSVLLNYKEEDLQLAGEERLRGIATQLFREGNPVYLSYGMDSSMTVIEKNKNLEDDNHLVYISIGECVIPRYLHRSAEIVNKQTLQLLNGN